MKKLIIALGGNALIQKGQKGTAEEQFSNIRKPVAQMAELSKDYHLVITHGNGPQSGNLLLQQEACDEVPKMPLSVIGAQTQGQIGYMIERTLDEELMRLSMADEKLFLTILTYTRVKEDDPAFQNPTKPVGPAYPDPKPGFVKTAKGWRRVVPSPKPYKIYQYREIKRLMQDNFIIIACGGGGIPVFKKNMKLKGVEAVIDKDLATAKLGEQIHADIMMIATDEEKVALNFGKPNESRLDELTIADAKKYLEEGQFPAGSMGPKIQACINFIEAGGEQAIITSVDNITEALAGTAGTHFHL
ncbi:Carbamate kinase [Candidatus Lokiarchaeum ossiferum]|uniref:Carbamate kinase n=1 Tax=Candidatus Lokiarchaeum ossiferum TaxID=2951803 RepID=A0ABY6I117_9ARCH|nr:Carbamate kinase [Candidatus Lokiarchaeum sp. B-35]